jgi:protein-L-isoaspartate(D-aspartate) O-methyltransferase
MRACDRGNYAPTSSRDEAYEDHPLPIGYRATISAPHAHAACLELFERAGVVARGKKVLDVGSGTGYLSACFAELVGCEEGAGKVVGIEHIDALTKSSVENVKRDGKGGLLDAVDAFRLVTGDGRDGYEKMAPYDAIHVGASAEKIPEALLNQLAVGGRMVIPVGGSNGQALTVIDRLRDGSLRKRDEMGVMYVPLTSRDEQLSPTRF